MIIPAAAKAIVHSVTGVPESAPEHAIDVAWDLGLNLLRAVRSLDPESYANISIDELLARKAEPCE